VTGRRQPRPGPLVAVFDPGSGQHHAAAVVVRQLQSEAAVTGMDFFSSALRPFDAPSSSKGESTWARDPTRFPDSQWLASPMTHG